MTEFNNATPFTAIMAKSRPMPDLNYPRFHKWYNTSTNISSALAQYIGHDASAGRNFRNVDWCRREWHATAPPTRIVTPFSPTVAIDLTTPFYMLGGTAGNTAATEDTLVGPDYYNPPIRLSKDILALQQISDTVTANARAIFMRVKAIKHRFTFTNYSRFPLEVYYTVLPIGYKFQSLSDAAGGEFLPHSDMSINSYKKIVVPAVQDVNDRGQKRAIDLGMNLVKLWPEAYLLPPGTQMTATTAAGSANSNSPWISMLPGTSTESQYVNIPPGQIQDDAFGTPDLASNRPVAGLRLQWFAKLQNPRDLGFTKETNTNADGDFTGTNYDVHWNASWLCDIAKTTNHGSVHNGEKAYPNVVA